MFKKKILQKIFVLDSYPAPWYPSTQIRKAALKGGLPMFRARNRAMEMCEMCMAMPCTVLFAHVLPKP